MNDRFVSLTLEPNIPFAEAEAVLRTAVIAAEGVFGPARGRMEVELEVREAKRTFILNCGSRIGTVVARVFVWMLTQRYGERSFDVRPIRPGRSRNEGLCGCGRDG